MNQGGTPAPDNGIASMQNAKRTAQQSKRVRKYLGNPQKKYES